MTVVALDTYRARLGGSTIGAAAGIDPWCSPIRLWLEMTGQYEREETEAMTWGKRLQPVIFDALREQGYDAHETPQVELRDDATPWLVGHPDGLAREGIVEAKAMGRGTDYLPPHHEAQVQTYMRLGGESGAVVAQLAGLAMTVWEVERNDRLADVLLARGATFMEYVRERRQPPPEGHPDDRAALLAAHPSGDADTRVRETRAMRDARRELRSLLDAEKARKARIDHLRAVYTDGMREASIAVDAYDAVVATWANVTARRLDTDRLKREHARTYEAYATETTTRRFTLK